MVKLVRLREIIKRALTIATSLILITLLIYSLPLTVTPGLENVGDEVLTEVDTEWPPPRNIYEVEWDYEWYEVASTALRYFRPGVGVDRRTGLVYGNNIWHKFTDWDLASYIFAILAAYKLGVMPAMSEWGSISRLERVLSFLENREVLPDGRPYNVYSSEDGSPQRESGPAKAIFTARLLYALERAKLVFPVLSPRIDKLKVIYAELLKSWVGCPDKDSSYILLLNNIMAELLGKRPCKKLGNKYLTTTPILMNIFEVIGSRDDIDKLFTLYKIQEERYNNYGVPIALGEGYYPGPTYAYGWLVSPYGNFDVEFINGTRKSNINIFYTHVALGMRSLFITKYTAYLSRLASILASEKGFLEGFIGDGRAINIASALTNGLALEAALYALSRRDLAVFPYPFILRSDAGRTLVIIPESKGRGIVGQGYASDAIAGMVIYAYLSRSSKVKEPKIGVDEWIAKVRDKTVSLVDNYSHLVVIGSPAGNLVSYYYNSNAAKFNIPVILGRNDRGDFQFVVREDGETFARIYGPKGETKVDYGLVTIFNDVDDRLVLLMYGLGPDATRISPHIFYKYELREKPVKSLIFKYYDSDGDSVLDSIAIVKTFLDVRDVI